MKKSLVLLLLLIFISLVPVYAAQRENTPTTTIIEYSSSQLIQTGVTRVYRVYFYPTANGGFFTLYNCLTLATTATTNAKAEGIEATAKNGQPQDFTANPVEFDTGLYLDISNGRVLVEYE